METRPAPALKNGRQKKLWTTPELAALPKLTDLTLVTGSPIPGEGDSGGGTVF